MSDSAWQTKHMASFAGSIDHRRGNTIRSSVWRLSLTTALSLLARSNQKRTRRFGPMAEQGSRPRSSMKAASADRDAFLVAQSAAALSLAAFFYYLRQGQLLLYGDAVAHINIARRVIDSQTPGLLQLGTVWLPLPHLLMLPFLISRWMWQTGIGGSIPSLFAYVLSVAGIFRLVRSLVSEARGATGWPTRFAAFLAALIFALNPNLLYLQATAMTEAVYLALFIWAVVFFADARRFSASDVRKAGSSLARAGLALAAACLTRYDGWLLAASIVAIAVPLAWLGKWGRLKRGVMKLVALALAAPVLWLVYNAAVYKNPLEFANGPYSARAIEERAAVSGQPPHPGDHDLRAAFRYFFKSAELNVATRHAQLIWVALLFVGTAIVALFRRGRWPVLLLWTPALFYTLSVAYGAVPIFLPVWWPFSHYNLRYGIEMLPAFAVLIAIAAEGLINLTASPKVQIVAALAFLALVVLSYVGIWVAGPPSFEEAAVNSRSRIALEAQLASVFEKLSTNSVFLMYLGDHVGAFERAGIPLARVINEGNHRPWKRPSDPAGLWERALRHPAGYVNFVVAIDQDAVAVNAEARELEPLAIIRVTGQPQATIFRTRGSNQAR